jgi:hypothetical protein
MTSRNSSLSGQLDFGVRARARIAEIGVEVAEVVERIRNSFVGTPQTKNLKIKTNYCEKS